MSKKRDRELDPKPLAKETYETHYKKVTSSQNRSPRKRKHTGTKTEIDQG